MAKLVKRAAAPKDSSMEELEALQPEGQQVQAGGKTVTVKPFTFGKLLKALKHLTNLAGVLTSEMDDIDMMMAFTHHSDDVVGLLMLATGEDKEFFENLDAGEGIDIAMATYKVNEDFFARSLRPRLQKLGALRGSPSEKENPEKSSSDSTQIENEPQETTSSIQ